MDSDTAHPMCLDMKAAYDRVVRQKLIDVLVQKGIPHYLVATLANYLCRRNTTISIPGYHSKTVYHHSLGIVQGSPLSSILFAFYTSSILEHFEKRNYSLGHRV